MKATHLLLLLFLGGITFTSIAQTAGSGTLSSIESLAKQESANSEKVGELNRKHMDTYVLEDLKLKRLEEELRALEKKQLQTEMAVEEELATKLDEIENSQSWINRRESAERGYKEYNPGTCNAGGPPPICSANHWYSVSYDEAMREYNALVERELNKIRDKNTNADNALSEKSKELYDFQFGENEFAKKRDSINDEMNELTAKNSDIRDEIAALSKVYEDQIKEQAESMQNQDLQPWLRAIADKHYAELKIGILEAQMDELDEEEIRALDELRDKMNSDNEQKIETLNQQINLSTAELEAFVKSSTYDINADEQKLRSKRSDLRDVEDQLEKEEALTAEELNQLKNQQAELTNEIEFLESKIEDASKTRKNGKERREQEITEFKDEVWNLKVNLPMQILEAENDLKEAYSAKREILEDAKAGRQLKLNLIEEAISANESAFRQKVSSYENKVEPERIRLLSACKESGASCWGTGLIGDIWSSANNLISCAHQLESDTLYYTGCEIASQYTKTTYNGLVNGISDRELGVLRRQNSVNQYMDLLKKFE
ncbi:MAG: DNA repair exonuclease SbcCD ATPase subunit [Flavobacteriales bacterium]|jgi:DNA repair exonuclease SbcCD ATPase subunit